MMLLLLVVPILSPQRLSGERFCIVNFFRGSLCIGHCCVFLNCLVGLLLLLSIIRVEFGGEQLDEGDTIEFVAFGFCGLFGATSI